MTNQFPLKYFAICSFIFNHLLAKMNNEKKNLLKSVVQTLDVLMNRDFTLMNNILPSDRNIKRNKKTI